MGTLISLAKILFFPTALVALLSFLTLCAETMGFVDLSRLTRQALALAFVVCVLTGWLSTGPALFGDRWRGY